MGDYISSSKIVPVHHVAIHHSKLVATHHYFCLQGKSLIVSDLIGRNCSENKPSFSLVRFLHGFCPYLG